ncbi:MAG: ABC transporter substrate-binding protein [Caldilineaceae bacterium]
MIYLRQKPGLYAIIALLALLLAVTACAVPEPAPTQPGALDAEATDSGAEAVMTRAMTSEPASLDPYGPASSGLSLVAPYLFDTLVVRDLDNSIQPLLAESWETADDGLSITMHLKPGITFHDGTPLNAEAVKFSFDRFKETGARSPIYSGIAEIESVEAVDDTTVVFHFAQPTANFFSTITMPYAAVISPASIEKMESSGEGYPIGSGPFILEDWQAGQSLTMRKNPDYAWGSPIVDNTGAPYLDKLVFKVIPDATTQLAALEAGDVDAIFVNQPSHLQTLEQDENIEVYETVLNSLIYLGFNFRSPPFDEEPVRYALSHAIDKQQVVDLALGGLGIAAFAPLPPTIMGFDESLKEYELGYDPDEAIRLLEDAGFERTSDDGWQRDGQELKATLLTSTRPPNGDIATVLQSQIQAIGVPVEIQQLDGKAVMDATAEGAFDLLLWRYDWNDPDALNIFLSSDRIGGTNRVAYSNPEVDALLEQGARELDDAKRIPLYVEAQKLILEDAPWQPIYNPIDAMAINKRIQGAEAGYMGRMLVNDAKVVEP